eukprot:1462348-Prymnesium_polylepis.1
MRAIAQPQQTREEPHPANRDRRWLLEDSRGPQRFSKRAYGALQVTIHRHFEVLKWVRIQENSPDLGHYFLPPPGSKDQFSH